MAAKRVQLGLDFDATGEVIECPEVQTLASRFIVPPFSVLDARQPYWRERKRAWLARGIRSELGRGRDIAGQVEENRAQAELCCPHLRPRWYVGDSRELPGLVQGIEADLVFSCPPYADLERYSDDPRDLSTLDYGQFMDAFRAIVAGAVGLLKGNRFAVFVVGEVRDRRGWYYGFVPDTVRAFQDAGLHLYNEAILITPAGSLPIRAGAYFEAGRKLGKAHQNVLVFYKGDPRAIRDSFGPATLLADR